jgi:prefoldin subunit 5
MSWLASMFGGGKAEKDMDQHLDALRRQTREISHKLNNLEMKIESVAEPLAQLVQQWQQTDGEGGGGKGAN